MTPEICSATSLKIPLVLGGEFFVTRFETEKFKEHSKPDKLVMYISSKKYPLVQIKMVCQCQHIWRVDVSFEYKVIVGKPNEPNRVFFSHELKNKSLVRELKQLLQSVSFNDELKIVSDNVKWHLFEFGEEDFKSMSKYWEQFKSIFGKYHFNPQWVSEYSCLVDRIPEMEKPTYLTGNFGELMDMVQINQMIATFWPTSDKNKMLVCFNYPFRTLRFKNLKDFHTWQQKQIDN